MNNKKKKLSVTFKKRKKAAGLASISEGIPSTDVKINKKIVGEIKHPNAWNQFSAIKILLTVKKEKSDNNLNCDWEWITLEEEFEAEEEARLFIKHNISFIAEKYILRYITG